MRTNGFKFMGRSFLFVMDFCNQVLSFDHRLRCRCFAQPLGQIQGVMICRTCVPCSLLKEDRKAATCRFGSDLSSQSVAHPIQHDENGFRIFRNGFCHVAVLTAAPMPDVPMPAAGPLPEHLS